MNLLQVIAGMIMVLFLPGFTLIQALFPREKELDEEFDMLYRITLGIAMSIVVVILLGFVLGNPKVKGFTATNLWISLSLISLGFFIIGWYRGAYPYLGKLHPKLARAAPGIKADIDNAMAGKYISTTLVKMQGLTHERKEIKKKVLECERKARASPPSINAYYERKKKIYLQDLKEIDTKHAELEEIWKSEV